MLLAITSWMMLVRAPNRPRRMSNVGFVGSAGTVVSCDIARPRNGESIPIDCDSCAVPFAKLIGTEDEGQLVGVARRVSQLASDIEIRVIGTRTEFARVLLLAEDEGDPNSTDMPRQPCRRFLVDVEIKPLDTRLNW